MDPSLLLDLFLHARYDLLKCACFNMLLIAIISLALVSFLFSAFVVLRIVIPVLPPHPLSRRVSPVRPNLLAFSWIEMADDFYLQYFLKTLNSLNSVSLIFVPSLLQTRATFGSHLWTLSPSSYLHGKHSRSSTEDPQDTLSRRTQPPPREYGLPSRSGKRVCWLCPR